MLSNHACSPVGPLVFMGDWVNVVRLVAFTLGPSTDFPEPVSMRHKGPSMGVDSPPKRVAVMVTIVGFTSDERVFADGLKEPSHIVGVRGHVSSPLANSPATR
jgi:hypothetical protein